MKLRIKKRVNECDGINTLSNTMGIGNPIIGDTNGNFGSGDLWIKKRKKRYIINKKVK